MGGETGRERRRVAFRVHLVLEGDARTGVQRDASPDLEQVVVARRPDVGGTGLDHRQEQVLLLELAVGHAALAQQVGAADLEPGEVAAVPGDAHLVGLGVAHAQPRDGVRAHEAAPIRPRTACSGSPAAKAAAPTTTISAPASTTLLMFAGFTPPST